MCVGFRGDWCICMIVMRGDESFIKDNVSIAAQRTEFVIAFYSVSCCGVLNSRYGKSSANHSLCINEQNKGKQ